MGAGRAFAAAAFRPRNRDSGYGQRIRLVQPGRTAASSRVAARMSAIDDSGAGPMWYAIEGRDGPDVLGKRSAAREAHLARLHALRDEGRLLVAGPCPAVDAADPGPAGFSGSIVIARFESIADARAWADADP